MHYQDDAFHPTSDRQDEGYASDDESFANKTNGSTYISSHHGDDSSSVAKRKKMLKEYKQLDPGFHTIVRTSSNNKKIKIDLYTTSNVPGTKIRDAITGARFLGSRVGTSDEDYFFKVKLATGELGRDSGNLYFETPTQCEKHLRINISDKIKKTWTNKYEDFCKSMPKTA